MDLTDVLPALVEGIAQEVGVDMGELKIILAGDEAQLDVNLSRPSKSSITSLNGGSRNHPSLFP